MTIRLVLADDQALMRKGFRMILEAESDMTVVGEAEDGHGALRLVELYSPDVVLMDVRMPNLDGIEATRAICSSGSTSRVLILTTFDLDEYAFSGLRAGASGFLLKDVPPAELAQAIRTVASGDAVVTPRITKRLLEEYAHQLPDLSSVEGIDDGIPAVLRVLTGRERDVLLAVADGLSNAEIAARLYVSEATVKSHLGRILTKLGLRDRVQAVVFAFQTGLVHPS
jgi:DNA-binding NarL/FixJ family response regulator